MQQSTKATGGLPHHSTPTPTLPLPHTRPTPTAPLSDGTSPSLPTCRRQSSIPRGAPPAASTPTAIPPILSPVFPKRYGNLKQMPSELPFQTALCPNDSISSAFLTFNNQVCPNHRHPSRHRSHRQQKIEIDDEGQVSDTSAANAVTMPIAKSFSDSFSKGFAHRTDTAGHAARAWRFFVLRLFTGCLRCLRPSENLGIWFSDGLLLFALQIRQIKRFAVAFGQNGVDAGGKFNGGHHDAVRTGGHGTLSCKNSSNSNSHTDSPSDFTISANSCSGHTGRKVAPPSSTQKRHSPSSSANTYSVSASAMFFSVCRQRLSAGGLRMLSMACCG